jgi:putative ABC transport system permease protein
MTSAPFVPIGRRSLFADRRRAVLGVAGVATALVLVLALSGIFAGAMADVTRYIDSADADVVVAQPGVRTMHMTASSLPLDLSDTVGSIAGVDGVSPILFASDAVASRAGRQLAYVVGYVEGDAGGPAGLVEGAAPEDGEIVVDAATAARLGVDVGDGVTVLGSPWTVSGIADDMTSIVNSVAFVRFADFATVTGAVDAASYLLVRTDRPVDVAERIEAASGLSATTRERFIDEERAAVRDMSVDLLAVMSVVAFVIALVVIALLLYAITLSRLRDIGVMKALGAGIARIGGTVVAQAVWIVAASLATAVIAVAAIGAALGAADLGIPLVVEASSVFRVGIGALVAGLLAALLPLVRVTALDPASVFRR